MAEDRMLSDEILLGLIKNGGGGTNNYNDLNNLPKINGETLSGNKSASDLGLVAAESGKGLSSNDYTNEDKAIVGSVTAALAYKADKSAVKNEFIGTTAEWNALTTAQKKEYDTYQLTDDYTEGSGGLPDYSTTEQKTGQKWIDGKEIYFRVNTTPIAITINDNWYNSGFTGIDTIVNYIASMTRDGEPTSNMFNNGHIDYVIRDNVFLIKGSNFNLADNYIVVKQILYYTKAT